MRIILLGGSIVTVALTVSMLGAGNAAAQQYPGVEDLPEIKLSLTDISAPASDQGRGTQAFVDYARTASGGKIDIEVFWSSALMSIIEAPDGIASGLADMGLAFPVYTPAEFPVMNWFNTLSNQAKGGNPYGHLVINGVLAEFVPNNPALKTEFDEHGLHVLATLGGNAYDLMCTSPVRSLEEARGKRTRTPNQAFAKEIEAIGMIPVPLVATEIYEAFSRGVIDCIVLQPHTYVSQGLTDVPGDKYWVSIELSGWVAGTFLINKAKWDSLPQVARDILNDAAMRYVVTNADLYYKGHRDFANLIKEGRITAVAPDENLRAALQAHQDEEVAAMVTNPVPAGVDDPQAVVDHFMSLMAKWRGIVSELGFAPSPRDVGENLATWQQDRNFEPFGDRLAAELHKSAAER